MPAPANRPASIGRPSVQLDYKIWLDYRGRAFGDGPARLLAGVEQHGSLRKAAQELGMSYNKAWRILHAAEQRLGLPSARSQRRRQPRRRLEHHPRGPGPDDPLSSRRRRGRRGRSSRCSSATSPTGRTRAGRPTSASHPANGTTSRRSTSAPPRLSGCEPAEAALLELDHPKGGRVCLVEQALLLLAQAQAVQEVPCIRACCRTGGRCPAGCGPSPAHRGCS